jgi:DNA end-binding protein Ku
MGPDFESRSAFEFASMPPPSLWSGNLRLSLVLIPVKLCPAISNEEAVSFRMIHEPSGNPIRYVKGVHDGDEFVEVPDEEIVKGYEYAKGQHVLIDPKELDDLKLEAKHTIDMVRFVDEAEIDSRYWEKPYYLVPDGDEADEGYTVIRDALKQTHTVAIGQLIMHGRGHLVGIKAHGKGLMLSILRYGNEIRPAKPYFEGLKSETKPNAVALAAELIKRLSGRFEPEKMPDEYARAVQELVKAKVENRAPEVAIEADGKPRAPVINIMDALKQSMQKQGQAKVRDAVRKRMGKAAPKEEAPRPAARSRAGARRSLH